MKIVILGGTGLLGRALGAHFSTHQVRCFGREAFISASTLLECVKPAELLIQLAGTSIVKPWRKGYQQAIWNSRVKTNKLLADVIKTHHLSPKIICASAVGYYSECDCENPLDEHCEEAGTGFLAELAVAWESAAYEISDNVLIWRFGVILSKKGGAFAKMLPTFQLGLGAKILEGKQCFSWVHITDVLRAFDYAIEHDLSGVYNLTSPQPVPQKAFAKTLARSLRRPFFMKLFHWQLKLIFAQGSQVLTQSHAILPTKLLAHGFKFAFADVKTALADLVQKTK